MAVSQESRGFCPKTQQELSFTLESTRKAMSEVTENMRVLEEGRDRAARRIKELQKELDEAKRNLHEASLRDGQLRKELDAQRRQLENQVGDHTRATAELAASKKDADLLRSQLRDVTAQSDVLSKKAAELDKVLDERADLEHQLGVATNSLAAHEATIADLQAKLNRALSEGVALNNALDAERGTTESLQKQLAEIGDSARSLEERRKQQDAELSRRDGVIAERDASMAALREQLAHAEASRNDLAARSETLNSKMNALERDLRESQEQRHALEEQLRGATGSHKAAAQELSETREALTRTMEEREQLAQELAGAKESIEGQNAQLAAQGELLSALKIDLEVSRRAIKEFEEMLAELQGGLSPRLSRETTASGTC